MKVRQLIEALAQQDPDADVLVWGALEDTETPDCYLCELRPGQLLLSDIEYMGKILAPPPS